MKASFAATALGLLGLLAGPRPPDVGDRPGPPAPTASAPVSHGALLPSCPAKQLFDPASKTCIRRPQRGGIPRNQHHELPLGLPSGPSTILRHPDRSATWQDYLLPIDPLLSAVPRPGAPGVVELHADAGSVLNAIAVERQQGQSQVALVGELDGDKTIILLSHTALTGRKPQDLLLIFRGIERPAPGVVHGAILAPLAPLAYVPDDGTGRGRILFEARQLYAEHKAVPADVRPLLDASKSTTIDLRNVLLPR
ncbi:MAG: hypothetical protein VB934_05945 [Polyangiaceae bacterium]